MPRNQRKPDLRYMGGQVPEALASEFAAAVERLGLQKQRALAAAVASYVRAGPEAKALLHHDATLRYFTANGGDRSEPQTTRLGAEMPAALIDEFSATAGALGLGRARVLATAVSAFTHASTGAQSRLYHQACGRYYDPSNNGDGERPESVSDGEGATARDAGNASRGKTRKRRKKG